MRTINLRIFILLISFAFFPQTGFSNVNPISNRLLSAQIAIKGFDTQNSTLQIEQLRAQIANEESLEKARALALEPTDAAISAIHHARLIMPFSENLSAAEVRITEFRSHIEKAGTPNQVADEFSGMMVAWLDDDNMANVDIGDKSCNYSSGEVIAIVVGLILGIIPGIILLIVLC